MNRNVLVQEERITAVFDWGCALYGDHLYDLAWFEFWAPWTPQLDIEHLKAQLLRRWQEVGYAPEDKEARLTACYLHIGSITWRTMLTVATGQPCWQLWNACQHWGSV